MLSTAENSASTGSGIARYPSGIQPWNGNAGIFTRNAAANARNSQFCVDEPSARSARSENANDRLSSPEAASTPVATAAVSISSEPTSV